MVCIKLTKSFPNNRKNKTRAVMETVLPLQNDASPLEKWHSLEERERTLRRKRTWLHHMESCQSCQKSYDYETCCAQLPHGFVTQHASYVTRVLCDECVAGRMLLQRKRFLIEAIELITILLTVNDRSNKFKRSYLSLSQSLSKSV